MVIDPETIGHIASAVAEGFSTAKKGPPIPEGVIAIPGEYAVAAIGSHPPHQHAMGAGKDLRVMGVGYDPSVQSIEVPDVPGGNSTGKSPASGTPSSKRSSPDFK